MTKSFKSLYDTFAKRSHRDTRLPIFLLVFTLLVNPLFSGCGTTSDPARPAEPATTTGYQEPAASPDIDEILESMSLREKVGHLFLIAARGGFFPEDNRNWERMVEAVENHQVSGIMFFSGNVYDQAIITNRLQQKSRLPLWVSQDMEFGAAMRLHQATWITPAMGVAATGNVENAYQKGRITALEAKAMGIHQIYAPVLDINNNPLNPVINVRSYSEDPDTVARYGIAFMDGVRDVGIMPTAKHFPGHGDTDVDSHVDLPVLPFDYERLAGLELKPFRSAIEAGLPSVMTAHIALPNLAQFPEYPGTLDPYITNTLLRDSLAFDGLIVTDGMGMRGIRNFFDSGEAAVLAIKAGVDQILLPPNLLEALDAVELAVLTGEITEERIDRSVRRILQMKKDAGLFSESRLVDIDRLPEKINIRQHRMIADHIARESITLLKNDNLLLPIQKDRYDSILVVNITDGRRPASDHITGLLSRNLENISSVTVYPSQCERDSLDASNKINRADLVIAVSHIAVRTAEDINLDETVSPFLAPMFEIDRPVIAISLGTPYAINNMIDADVHLLGWAPHETQQKAVTEVLLGRANAKGRLPVSIPPLYRIGDGITTIGDTTRSD